MADDMDLFGDFLRAALGDVRALEPSPAQVQAAVRAAATTGRPARMRVRRVLAIAVATALLAVGTALAIPAGRDAILGGFESFREFITGGGDPPGTPISPDEAVGELNWFFGSDVATGSAIAQAGDVRLVAYRDQTGAACLNHGLAFGECRPDDEWRALLTQNPIYVGPAIPPATADGRIPFTGLVADAVTAVVVTYADGGTERADGIRHGFVLYVEAARRPQLITAQDASGGVVGTEDISDRQWVFTP